MTGILVPEEYGGSGLGYTEYIAILKAFARISPSIVLSIAAHNSLCVGHILYFGSEAVQIFGGYGYTKDYPVEKFYRDSKLCTIGEGTSEIQKLVISRKILE